MASGRGCLGGVDGHGCKVLDTIMALAYPTEFDATSEGPIHGLV